MHSSELRPIARQRQKLVGLLSSEKNRMHKGLTDAGIRPETAGVGTRPGVQGGAPRFFVGAGLPAIYCGNAGWRHSFRGQARSHSRLSQWIFGPTAP